MAGLDVFGKARLHRDPISGSHLVREGFVLKGSLGQYHSEYRVLFKEMSI
jgi:hypothetical protein